MDLAQLMVRLGITGLDQVVSGLNATNAAINKTATGAQGAGAAVDSLNAPMMRLLQTAMSLKSGLLEVATGIAAVMSFGLASHMENVNIALTNMLHSGDAAADMLERINKLAMKSPYGSQALAAVATPLLNIQNVNLPASQRVGQTMNMTQSIADVSAAMAMSEEQMRSLGQTFAYISHLPRLMPRSLAGLGEQMPLQDIIQAATKKKFKDVHDAMQYLESSGDPAKAMQIIVKGIDALYHGQAELASLNSITGIFERIHIAVNQMFLPTAEKVLRVLEMIASKLIPLSEFIAGINKFTHGAAGAAVVISLSVRYWNIIRNTMSMVVIKIQELSQSLNQLAASAALAAKNVQTTAAMPPAGAVGTGVAGAAAVGTAGATATAAADAALQMDKVSRWSKMVSWVKNIPTMIAEGGGVMAMLKTGVVGLLKGMGPGLITLLASAGVGWIGDKIGGKAGGVLQGAATGAAWGSMGFRFGPIVGGITTALGAIIGGVMGYKNASTKNKDSENLEKAANSLQEISSRVSGGGNRARSFSTDIAVEMAIARALVSGTGVM